MSLIDIIKFCTAFLEMDVLPASSILCVLPSRESCEHVRKELVSGISMDRLVRNTASQIVTKNGNKITLAYNELQLRGLRVSSVIIDDAMDDWNLRLLADTRRYPLRGRD